MAKGKSSSAAKPAAASRSKQKAVVSQDRASGGPAKKPATSAQREISDEQIGHVAGQIWGLLHNHGDQTLAAVKKSIDAPEDLIVAGIGWLAREGKLNFSSDGRSVQISLR